MKEPELSLFEENNNPSSDNPFCNRKIVLEGTFSCFNKEAIKSRIKRMGGDVISGDITKNVHFFLVGSMMSDEKMLKYRKLEFDGFHIKLLKEEDLIKIFNGEYDGYYAEPELKKDLRLTIEHYNKKHVVYLPATSELSGRQYMPNPIYGKNVYLGSKITGKRSLLAQMLGLIGAYSGQSLSDSTQIIVLSQEAFLALQNGKQHEELSLIQDIYNRGLAQWYDFLLTTEDELLDWYKQRCNFTEDSVCSALYNDFINSK